MILHMIEKCGARESAEVKRGLAGEIHANSIEQWSFDASLFLVSITEQSMILKSDRYYQGISEDWKSES